MVDVPSSYFGFQPLLRERKGEGSGPRTTHRTGIKGGKLPPKRSPNLCPVCKQKSGHPQKSRHTPLQIFPFPLFLAHLLRYCFRAYHPAEIMHHYGNISAFFPYEVSESGANELCIVMKCLCWGGWKSEG